MEQTLEEEIKKIVTERAGAELWVGSVTDSSYRDKVNEFVDELQAVIESALKEGVRDFVDHLNGMTRDCITGEYAPFALNYDSIAQAYLKQLDESDSSGKNEKNSSN